MKHRALIALLLACQVFCFTLGGRAVYAQDPIVPGPYNFGTADYDLGDQAFAPVSIPERVELRGTVRYPLTIPPPGQPAQIPAGPLPLIVLLHGNHYTVVSSYRRRIRRQTPAGAVTVTTFTYNNVPGVVWPPPRLGDTSTSTYPDGADTITDTITYTRNSTRIDNYQGYAYLARRLATQGFIVVSISANGINASSVGYSPDDISARVELIRRHLQLWQDFNNGNAPAAPVDLTAFNQFKDKVDLSRIGLMGHSRGGEAVVQYVRDFPNGGASPFTVLGVLSVAPTDIALQTIHNVPLGVVLPYCDGDVSGLVGAHFFDRQRYTADRASRHMFVVLGANHNFFNTEWSPGSAVVPQGAADDWSNEIFLRQVGLTLTYAVRRSPEGSDPDLGSLANGTLRPGRLNEADQRDALLTAGAAFFRTYVNGEAAFRGELKGDARLPIHSADPDKVHISWHPPSDQRLLIDDFDHPTTTVPADNNVLGGPNDQKLLDPYDLRGIDLATRCIPTDPSGTPPPEQREPHTQGEVLAGQTAPPGLQCLRFSWDSDNAVYYTEMFDGLSPSYDVSGYSAFQFRAGVNYAVAANRVGDDQDLIVTLADANGNSDDFQVGDIETTLNLPYPLYYPPGQRTRYAGQPTGGPAPHLLENAVRIPLSQFPHVDLTHLSRIYFRFTSPTKGALVMTDILFTQ